MTSAGSTAKTSESGGGPGQLDNVADILPLSPVQAGMLYECLTLEDQGAAYAALVRVDLSGPVDAGSFREILSDVILAPDSQRAVFVHQGLPSPVQVIRQQVELPFAFDDLAGQTDQESRLEAIAEEMRGVSIPLTIAPLMRLRLVRVTSDSHVLFWKFHHLIADGWSLHNLLGRILARLNKTSEPADGPSFKSHLQLLRKRDLAADRAFWAQELDGLTGPCLLTEPQTTPQLATERYSTKLAKADVQALAQCARQHRTTLATLLSVGWALCLRRLTGNDDVVFALVVSGRDSRIPGIDRAVGSYAGIVPRRVSIDPAASLARLIADAEAASIRQADYETSALNDAIRSLPGNELPFDTLLSITNFQRSNPIGPIQLQDVRVDNHNALPLNIIADIGEEIAFHAYFDQSRLPPETTRGVVDMFADVLRTIAGEADQQVQALAGPALPVLTPLPNPEHPHHAIHRHALRSPDQIALRFGEVVVRYGDLDRRARMLAAELSGHGIGHGDLVPVLEPRSERAVIAMLGVLYAGAAYVPIDPDYPEARQRQILDQIRPRVLVGGEGTLAGSALIVAVPEQGSSVPPADVAETLNDDPAYVIFTSGSTGKPKGVVVSHGNLAWSNGARDSVYGGTPKAFLHLSSFAFDSSVVGLYWTLAAGGTLVIAPPRAEQDPAGLLADAGAAEVTHMLALPELWRAFLAAGPVPASMNTVIVAGEAVAKDLTDLHFAKAPLVRLFNEYGPTEGTVWCAAAELRPDQDAIPIGQAPLGAALDVCDGDGHPLPRGIEGELIVRGQGVAQGYLGDSQATARVFTEGPERRYRTGDRGIMGPDGTLFFRGRQDSQIKLRGHRVELEEIEAAARLAGATDAGAGFADSRIVLAVTDAADAVQANLPKYLPAALLPLPVVAMAALPRLPNGKIDRAAIARQMPEAKAGAVGSTGFFEERLAECWSKLLKTQVGPETNFFDAGGDSLMSIHMLAKAEEEGITLRPGDLFQYPVLRDLAAMLRQRAERPVEVDYERLLSVSHERGRRRPFFMIHGVPKVNAALAAALGQDRPLAFRYSHEFGGRVRLSDTVEGLAAEMIQTIKRIQAEGPYLLGGYSFGGIIALEAARQLEANGEHLSHLFLIDPSYGVAPPSGHREPAQRRLQRIARAGKYALDLVRSRINANRIGVVLSTYRLILTRYRLGVVRCPATLFQTERFESHGSGTIVAVPNVRTIDLPCEHLELIHDDDTIVEWTSKLAAEINRLEA